MFEFFGCFEGVVAPQRADATVMGTSSIRAASHCEPFRAGSSYGWHIYPPFSFLIRWDGRDFEWIPEGAKNWLPLTNVPAAAVAHARGEQGSTTELPILSSLPEAGALQVWTGLTARVPAGWSLLVSGVPNFPGSLAFEVLEGIIEADWFHGPIITVLKFRKTDQVIHIERTRPLLTVRPLLKQCYAADTLSSVHFEPSVPDSDFAEVAEGALDSVRRPGKPGGYRDQVLRRRRQDPVNSAVDHDKE